MPEKFEDPINWKKWWMRGRIDRQTKSIWWDPWAWHRLRKVAMNQWIG